MDTLVTQPAPPAVPTRADFPDWLSPMLVKELRQGVRTRIFVSQFILLQVAMLVTISLTLLVSATGDDATQGSVFFWLVVGGSILVALPLSGLNAVGGEVRANTLELIFLTRQTALRIVAGKWLAIFVQSLLFVCAVLPYLVLRYFVGGVNVTNELLTLGSMLVGSALLTALSTGLSAYPARLGRSLAFIGSFFLLFGLEGSSFFAGRAGVSVNPGAGLILASLACWAILLVLFLEAGAARIAPPAENHSAVMRLLAAAGLLVATVSHYTLRTPEAITFLTLVIAALVCAGAVCEEPRWLPSLYRPFARRGFWGRLAGRLLYPGWHTGVWFTLCILGGFTFLLYREGMLTRVSSLVRLVALLGTLLFPAAVVRAFFPKTKRALILFFAVMVLGIFATGFCAFLDNNLHTSTMDLCSFLPVASLIYSLGDSSEHTAGRFLAVGATTILSLCVLLIASRRPLRQTRQIEIDSLAPATVPPLPPSPTAPADHVPLA